jgi:phosphohistidine phosphatase
MDLLVIRHADAGDAAEFAKTGRPDDERPLSDEGRKKMRQVTRGLRALVPEIVVLAASPLVRAQQTAEIVAAEFGDAAIETVPALRPGQPPAALAQWLGRRRPDGLAAVVGHEPHLGTTVGWLLTGSARSVLDLKKGAACLLSCEAGWSAGAAVLRWALTPGQLRGLGA